MPCSSLASRRRPPCPHKKASFNPKPSRGRLVWFPVAKPPEWLDGTMVGDSGFNPFGLGKPAEYLHFDLDSLDQNLAKNVAGEIIGTRGEATEVKPTPFQQYTEVFGLQRFRECELIHGRRAMLGALGALAIEAFTEDIGDEGDESEGGDGDDIDTEDDLDDDNDDEDDGGGGDEDGDSASGTLRREYQNKARKMKLGEEYWWKRY